MQCWMFLTAKGYKMTDTEMLEWLEENARPYSAVEGWSINFDCPENTEGGFDTIRDIIKFAAGRSD